MVALEQVHSKTHWTAVPMKRAVELDASGVVADAWAVGKAAHEDVREPPSVHDADCTVLALADLAYSADMACSGVEQDYVA